MDNKDYKIYMPKEIGVLHIPYTNITISVYRHIGWFKKRMIKWCFGLEYRSLE